LKTGAKSYYDTCIKERSHRKLQHWFAPEFGWREPLTLLLLVGKGRKLSERGGENAKIHGQLSLLRGSESRLNSNAKVLAADGHWVV